MNLNCLLCNTDFNINDYAVQMTTYVMCSPCFEKSRETARITKAQENARKGKSRKSKPKSAAALLAKTLLVKKGVTITAKQIRQANRDTRKRDLLRIVRERQ